MARLGELGTKIKEINNRTGQEEEVEYSPVIRNKLKDLQQHGLAKATGWAVAATGSALKSSSAWASRRILGNTVGGLVADKIESIGSSKTGVKGIISSIENMRVKVVAELKDLATSEKTVANRLGDFIQKSRDNSSDKIIGTMIQSSKNITGNPLKEKTLANLDERIRDTRPRVLDKNLPADIESELKSIKDSFMKDWMHDNPNEKQVPKKLEKQLDVLLKGLSEELEIEKESLKKAELSDKNTEKLLERLVENSGKSEEELSIQRAKDENSSYATKESKDDEKKSSILELITKYLPLIGGAISSLLGAFRGFPANLITGLLSGLTAFLPSLLSPFKGLLGGAGKVAGAIARTAVSAAPMLASVALPAVAVAAAGYAGWKTGEALEKNYGDGNTGKRVAKMLAFFGNEEAKQALENDRKYEEAQSTKPIRKIKPKTTVEAKIANPVTKAVVPTTSKADQLQQTKQSYDKWEAEKAKPKETSKPETSIITNNGNTTNITQKSTVKINPSRNTESSYQRMTDRLSSGSII